ncbi:unnamed protein product [Choristocarpus tenellus]
MTNLSLVLRKKKRERRLPITEAAYNSRYEVLQFFRLRRIPLANKILTWVYPRAPPPFAPPGHDGSLESCSLDVPMTCEGCAEAGSRDIGSKQYFPGEGWVKEGEGSNHFTITQKVAQAMMREVNAVRMMGTEEAKRRRIVRGKV